MRWKFWEIDLHLKRTYQCYLPEATPVTNTLAEVTVLSFGVFIAYLYIRIRHFDVFANLSYAFLVLYFVGMLITFLALLGTKNYIKWQKLERRLFKEHQSSLAETVN